MMNSSQLNSQKIWQELTKIEYDNTSHEVYQRKNMPTQYKVLKLDFESFTKNLSQKSTQKIKIQLPDADGNLTTFEVEESSNFELGLQQKFPEIKAYVAKSIQTPTTTARISVGLDGFHATIYPLGESTIYIDPITKNNLEYMVYSRKNLPKQDEDFKCLVENEAKAQNSNLNFKSIASDGKLRTYRIAIACSGEYSQFHLNRLNVGSNESDAVKKAAVLSAMNTSMSRINGVFNKDLGVMMNLVSNNDQIIFLNPATDNITDGDANTMIDEVQTICDTNIGSANYDIGHIFSIGGDGLAGLGVVCFNGQKARGVTGIASPVGDPYDIDYVAHELGHQFGANHTQNNNCNRNLTTAVEVGSGTTIMSYSGICAPNVFGVGSSTGNSDDYFHAVSITEMLSIINTTGSCAVLSDVGNFVPTANAGLDYTIPKSTPFKLTGVATDANGTNALTYNWEQIDNQVATMPPLSTNTVGPTFRSFPSLTSPTRYFPQLTNVIAGTNNQWEVLPTVARNLNFALTVRDNHSLGSATARDDVKITVVDAASFTVAAPSTNVTWNTGSTQTITWNVGTTNTTPINCQTVNIKLSTDGGATFPITLKSNTPNDGSESVLIPNNATTTARIMVEAADNVFYNVNSSNFTIVSTTPTFVLTNTSSEQNACNSGNQTASYTLNFDFVNGFNQTVSLSASGQPSGAIVSFSPSTINADGNITMTVSNLNGVAANTYTITVTGTSASVTQQVTASLKVLSTNFTAVNLTSPSNGATFVNLSEKLKWDVNTNATSYDVQIASDSNFSSIVSSGTVTTNEYTATNLNELTIYYWRVKPKNSCGEGTFSNAFNFTTKSCALCNSNGNIDYATSTTLVSFNTINNSTTKTVPYTDYSSTVSTTVKRNSIHNLTVNVNTDGNFRVQVKVWIDWNQDCVFNTTDEEYDLGYAANTINGPSNNSPLAITIPTSARLGATKMRVSSKYTDPNTIEYPTSCELGFDGEVEDYSVVIEEATASIVDVNFEGLRLYPNPSKGIFTLTFDTLDVTITELEFFDVRGRKVHQKVYSNTAQKFREQIDISNLSSGLYLLKIKNGGKESLQKIMVE